MNKNIHPKENFLSPCAPRDFPGLVSFWQFEQSADSFVAQQGEPYCLQSGVGPLQIEQDEEAPFGGTALRIEEGQWLAIPRRSCPQLNIHGRDGHLTLIAWIKRKRTKTRHCEFIAGLWNESNRGRQYGLFLNIVVWNEEDRIFGHLSHVGGPTPGYRYCIDGSQRRDCGSLRHLGSRGDELRWTGGILLAKWRDRFLSKSQSISDGRWVVRFRTQRIGFH